MAPSSIVDAHLRGCLPPGVPPSYREIVRAKRVGSGRRQVFRADLIMFDGEPATVEVFKAGEALGIAIWGHHWTAMPGGACSYEDGRWQRFSEQADLFAEPTVERAPVEDRALKGEVA